MRWIGKENAGPAAGMGWYPSQEASTWLPGLLGKNKFVFRYLFWVSFGTGIRTGKPSTSLGSGHFFSYMIQYSAILRHFPNKTDVCDLTGFFRCPTKSHLVPSTLKWKGFAVEYAKKLTDDGPTVRYSPSKLPLVVPHLQAHRLHAGSAKAHGRPLDVITVNVRDPATANAFHPMPSIFLSNLFATSLRNKIPDYTTGTPYFKLNERAHHFSRFHISRNKYRAIAGRKKVQINFPDTNVH